jgi:hypothetical protein
LARGVAAEHKIQAAGVLAHLAGRYAEEEPDARVDDLTFVMRVGAAAYDAAGRSLAGRHRVVAAVVREQAPSALDAQCGPFAVALLEAARALGWSDEDNEPVIPRVPGPRRSEESGRVPGPRPAQAVGR